MSSSFVMTSPSFTNKGKIPQKYTCDGSNISPELRWKNVPAGAKSLALIVDDPDAPTKNPWVHWIVFNIDPHLSGFEENADVSRFKTGINDSKDKRGGIWHYAGPCPPHGSHRYFFKLYALDSMLDVQTGASKNEVMSAMEGHILGQVELIGLYSR